MDAFVVGGIQRRPRQDAQSGRLDDDGQLSAVHGLDDSGNGKKRQVGRPAWVR